MHCQIFALLLEEKDVQRKSEHGSAMFIINTALKFVNDSSDNKPLLSDILSWDNINNKVIELKNFFTD